MPLLEGISLDIAVHSHSTMESDSGQYCRICFRGVDYSCHRMAPSLAVGWESFVVEWPSLVMEWPCLVVGWSFLIVEWPCLVVGWSFLVVEWPCLVMGGQL